MRLRNKPKMIDPMEDAVLNARIWRNVVYIQFVMILGFASLTAVLIWILYKNVRRWGLARRYLESLRPDPEAARWAKVERTLFESRRQLIDDQLGRVRGDLDRLLVTTVPPCDHSQCISTFQRDDLPPPPTEAELKQFATVRSVRESCQQQPTD